MIKIIGYTFLLFSCLLWGLIFIIPWFDFSKSQIAGITTALIIAGEILFYVSIIFIGKSFIDKIKNKLKFWKTKPPSDQ
ncbi:MAG: transporter suffix domain-containing protein [Bacteroidetes bacterium]|nr:MAG: transporter suffix domain-containing protein [Bacteroidota bacterium]